MNTDNQTRKLQLKVTEPTQLADAIIDTNKLNKDFLNAFYIGLALVAQNDKTEADKANLVYSFDINKYKGLFNLEYDKNVFTKMKNITTELLRNNPIIVQGYQDAEKDCEEVIAFPVFQSVSCIRMNNRMVLQLIYTENMKKYLVSLLEQKGRKIYFELTDVLQLKSAYAKKMYPYLLKRVHKNESDRICLSAEGNLQGEAFDTIQSMNNFREVLRFPNSYKTERILKIATDIAAEITEKTHYNVSVVFNGCKSGGRYSKITHLCWRMEDKNSTIYDMDIELPFGPDDLIDDELPYN